MTDDARRCFPVFVFDAKTGVLAVNVFGRKYPRARQRREIAEVVRGLRSDTRAGRIEPDGLVIGWPAGGLKPTNAVDTSDEEAMAWWFARAFRVAVRVDAEAMTSAADELIFADQEIGHAQD